MSGFACSCFACQADFTAALPTIFCSDACRGDHAAKSAALLEQYHVDHPDLPWPGDRVRLRTDEDRAFGRDVTAGLATL